MNRVRSNWAAQHWRRAAALALTLAHLGLAPQAQAGRPLITDDARLLDAQSCQVETWVRRSPQGSEYWALPGCNPTGNLELTLGGARLNQGPNDSVFQVQAKTVFQTLESSRVSWGLAAGATRAHPQGEAEAYAYVPFTWAALPDRAFVHVNIGLRRDAASHTTQRTWGLGLEGVITPRFAILAEALSQERGRSLYHGGLRVFLVPDRVQFDATVGNRTGQAPGQGNERWFSFGIRLQTPPFLN